MTNSMNLFQVDPDQSAMMDRSFRTMLAQTTTGMSPLEFSLATLDWISHLSISPGKRTELAQSYMTKLGELGVYSIKSLIDREAKGPASDRERRMSSEEWKRWPFNVLAETHQTAKDWIRESTIGVEGVRSEHEIIVHAAADQLMDMLSPANFPFTNPEVLKATWKEKGKNLFRGAKYFLKDQSRNVYKNGLEENAAAYVVGENLAITPGNVVFQNDLIELIQYTPKTKSVGAEPVLITPAWIMKYYILDLSPKNSMAKYLTEQGKTVFMVSWKNPDERDRDVGLEDYVHNGFMAALDAVTKICSGSKVHAVGYCIGGTLLSIAAAAMARDGDDRLESISLFAAQTDFSEAGEIQRFISPSQLSFLEKLMSKRGYLGSENMGGAFSALRASDLIYAGMVDRYFMGNEARLNDLMSWNADGTRMPYRMHYEYLEKLYLHNQLASNKLTVDGRVVSLSDISVPMFVLGTETDHVAPWKSVYKIVGLTNNELTFALTSGGHNAGVISGPQHPRRRYRMHLRNEGDKFIDPDSWIGGQEPQQGSWWPAWNEWLESKMTKHKKPPPMGNRRRGLPPLREAPGEYVFG